MQQPTKDEMVDVLELQRTDFLQEGSVTFKTRIDRLERAINLLKSNESHLIDAMSTDFGHRSTHQSLFTDIAGSIGPLRIAQCAPCLRRIVDLQVDHFLPVRKQKRQ
jgi:coniferyl-aldehyde dehydrogenase